MDKTKNKKYGELINGLFEVRRKKDIIPIIDKLLDEIFSDDELKNEYTGVFYEIKANIQRDLNLESMKTIVEGLNQEGNDFRLYILKAKIHLDEYELDEAKKTLSRARQVLDTYLQIQQDGRLNSLLQHYENRSSSWLKMYHVEFNSAQRQISELEIEIRLRELSLKADQIEKKQNKNFEILTIFTGLITLLFVNVNSITSPTSTITLVTLNLIILTGVTWFGMLVHVLMNGGTISIVKDTKFWILILWIIVWVVWIMFINNSPEALG